MEIIKDSRELIAENEALKRALLLTLNAPLIRKLKDALDRIEGGDYLTEEEFFSQ